MVEEKQVVVTAEGLKKLQDELEYLKTEKRNDVREKIQTALGYGDLSENSEYDEAKNEQAQVETRIAQLEQMLKNIKLIDENDLDTDTVNLGSHVLVHDVDFDEDVEYTIVGSTEADPVKSKISDESPVGKALLGASVGDTVTAQLPDGDPADFKILKILR